MTSFLHRVLKRSMRLQNPKYQKDHDGNPNKKEVIFHNIVDLG